jgi:creatinine amidohydrolase/Fe(II)-dependent formamide hydrolase-like protein
MPGFLLEELTSPEAARLAGEGAIGLIAAAAVEQHGPHLPLGTDAIIARHLADEVAARLDAPAIVAPVLPGGLSSHHLGFPGTVDLPRAVFDGYVRALLDTYDALGVREVALFSAHGGNFGALAELEGTHGGVRVIAYTDILAYLEVMMAAAASTGLHAPETDAHAGGLETSQMLFVFGEERISFPPDLEGYVAAEPGWMEQLHAKGMKALSPNGILGRPAGATAAAGEAICAALAGMLADWVTAELGVGAARA